MKYYMAGIKGAGMSALALLLSDLGFDVVGYDDAKEQNEFGFCSVKKDGKWGSLKSDGTVVVEPTKDLENYLYVDFISEWNRYNDLRINVYTK
mgnify:CR=1 FL=1